MKIVSLEELKQMPNGTLYAEFSPDVYTSEPKLIMSHSEKGGWNSAVTLVGSPETFVVDAKEGEIDFGEWDDSDADLSVYPDDKYIVFEEKEIDIMISILQCAKGIITVDELREKI